MLSLIKNIPVTETKITSINVDGFWHTVVTEVSRTLKAIQFKNEQGKVIWLPKAGLEVAEDCPNDARLKKWVRLDLRQEKFLGMAE